MSGETVSSRRGGERLTVRSVGAAAALVLCWTMLALPAGASDVPTVEVVAEAVLSSWQPILPADAVKAVRHVALEALSRSGLAQFVARKPDSAGPPKTDYALKIQSHIMEDAQTHTVYLVFGPGARSDAPSLHAAHTVVLAGLRRDVMLARIQASARAAAAQLLVPLKPALSYLAGRTGAMVLPAAGKAEATPWQWPTLRVPRPKVDSAVRDLSARDAAKRQAAVRVLASLAFDQASPRHALERCALEHPDKALRRDCLVALRPLARRHSGSRRVVIEVFRKTEDTRQRREAADQMQSFSGVARSWAIQAWMESAARGRGVGPLKGLGDLPNLDLTIRSCLLAARKDRLHGGRSYIQCFSLLDPVPFRRRYALLWPFVKQRDPGSPFYLPGAGDQEGRIGTAWQWGAKGLVELMPRWDPKLEAVLWHRYQSKLSDVSLDLLSDCAAPSARLVKRLLHMVRTSGKWPPLHGLVRVAQQAPALRKSIHASLSELLSEGGYAKSLSKRGLEDAIRKLEREANR